MTPYANHLRKLLNTKQAAARLNLSPTTLEIWRWRGKGPKFLKLGKAVRYAEEDLDAFEQASRRSNTSQEQRQLAAV